jgi:hypothetical protein
MSRAASRGCAGSVATSDGSKSYSSSEVRMASVAGFSCGLQLRGSFVRVHSIDSARTIGCREGVKRCSLLALFELRLDRLRGA